MKDFSDLKEYSEKRLRTLRNNLNNRLESFKKNADSPKALQPSHKLFGLSETECKDLLKKVQTLLK
ncbi:MAG: hypothetical protein ACOYL6_10780 [Bacteriovoracaceae bacterium]